MNIYQAMLAYLIACTILGSFFMFLTIDGPSWRGFFKAGLTVGILIGVSLGVGYGLMKAWEFLGGI